MNKMKKILSLLFVSVLVCFCFAGCSKNEEKPAVSTEENVETPENMDDMDDTTAVPTKEPEAVITKIEEIVSELGRVMEDTTLFEEMNNSDALFVNETEYWLAPQTSIKLELEAYGYNGYGYYINPTNSWTKGSDIVLSAFDLDDCTGTIFGLSSEAEDITIINYIDQTYGPAVATAVPEDDDYTYYLYNITEDIVLNLSVLTYRDAKFVSTGTVLCFKDYLGYFIGSENAAKLGCEYTHEESNLTYGEKPKNEDGSISVRIADRIFTFSGLEGAEEDDDYNNTFYYTGLDGYTNVYEFGLESASSKSDFEDFLISGQPSVFADYIRCCYDTSVLNETYWEVIEEGQNYRIYRTTEANEKTGFTNYFPYVVYLKDFDCNVNVVYSDLEEEEESLENAHKIIEYFTTSVTVEYVD